ncbi:hypothetical protein D9613_011752 [Agrocybe pediades]|uniref:ATP-dependent DNA helicase n=1 Tax=Agrocybe pediades TaxID=84607 RepID=A0A8H4VK87_9AGAR|nr:hypothetical protein D9613_011752 [Agrocybe pediades]
MISFIVFSSSIIIPSSSYMPLNPDSVNIKQALSRLTIHQLLAASRGQLVIPGAARQKKEHLIEFISSHAPFPLLESLLQSTQNRKRPHPPINDYQEGPTSKRQCTASSSPHQSRFLQPPDDATVRRCFQDFYAATSNSALSSYICAVCARESCLVNGDTYEDCRLVPIGDIPNGHVLKPTYFHPKHTLYGPLRCLLEPQGVYQAPDGTFCARICPSCYASLHTNPNMPPKLSLANNMWIGPVPFELSTLTIPEQLLLALYYPRVFVFKLYPKKGHPDEESVHRAMRGNVVTFEQSQEDITTMIEGNFLPRPLSILSSLIAITFVGTGPLPRNWMFNTFRVRRPALLAALMWLISNNPKYYGHLHVDKSNLAKLPENDVPDEIWNIIRQNPDDFAVDQDVQTYIPDEEDDDGINGPQNQDGPDVIPLQVSGTNDLDLSGISSHDLMTWAVQNLWEKGEEGGYAVRHGSKPVHDFPPMPNSVESLRDDCYFEKAFPALYPYGVGGIEAHRPIHVDFHTHIQWSLLYHDRRFRRHETFAFVAFGILQRRQALGSAKLQIRRRNFDVDSEILSHITLQDLKEAEDQERRHQAINNPAVKLLISHLHATAARVIGTDASRFRRRSEMSSTSYVYNLPTLWATINPCDLHDPIAQIFTGEEIDMDHFNKLFGPDKSQRARNVACDPFAAAAFFHFLIRLVLKTLFGVEQTPYRVQTRPGILGHLSAYYGMVESQGRGSLHIHILLWMQDALSPSDIHTKLQSADFRDQVVCYIKSCIHAHIPGIVTREDLQQIPNEVDIAYSRPPDPSSPDFFHLLSIMESRIARAKQVHTCHPRRCLVPDKHGMVKCKRRAPWDCSDDVRVESNGKWWPERHFPYFNSWNPFITCALRCNNDLKLLTNGQETQNCYYYSSMYTFKKQGQSFQMSAIMAKEYAYHQEHSEYLDNERERNRLLLFRLVNKVNSQQELGAPMVMSYLMGWGDAYASHHYTTVYWSSFVAYLLKTFPTLKRASASISDSSTNTWDFDSLNEIRRAETYELHDHDKENCGDEQDLDLFAMDIGLSSNGTLYVKNQVTDYVFRNRKLSAMSVFAFFQDTWETRSTHEQQDHESVDSDYVETRGRPKQERYPYLSQHPSSSCRTRVKRPEHHNNIPNFVGSCFPRNDDSTRRDFYCASMLLLLKPWRNIRDDLKAADESWESAFRSFCATSAPATLDILSSIQYFHDSRTAATSEEEISSHVEDEEIMQSTLATAGDTEMDHHGESIQDGEGKDTCGFSLEELLDLLRQQKQSREDLYAEVAIQHAQMAGIFAKPSDCNRRLLLGRDESATLPSVNEESIRAYEANSMELLNQWRQEIADDIRRRNMPLSITGAVNRNSTEKEGISTRPDVNIPPSVQTLSEALQSESAASREQNETSFQPKTPQLSLPNNNGNQDISPDMLNKEQRRAYDIFIWHLDETLKGREPPPLRLIIYGEGGTGKSAIVECITKAFEERNAAGLLLKAAYTGIAASHINGKTLHTLGRIPINSKVEQGISPETRAFLEAVFSVPRYLIIDEYSMLAKMFLALFSRHAAYGKAAANAGAMDCSFGGMNVCLIGDLHQFPPVAIPRSDSLFYPSDPVKSKVESQIGEEIYHEFNTVVILRQQNRVQDEEWLRFLKDLRRGSVRPEHITMLKSLIVGHESSEYATDYQQSPWDEAPLITPRHSVRIRWNHEALVRHCQKSNQVLIVCPAEDSIRGRALTPIEEAHVQLREATHDKKDWRKSLPYQIEFAVGAKVLVTENIETDLDITNGARGEIVGMVLDEEEPPISSSSKEVHLTKLPLYILVRLERTKASQLTGLPPGVIPIEPREEHFFIEVKSQESGKYMRRRVRRRQYPMTLAWAYTDYRSQGQTIPFVYIDIARPPTGKMNMFNLYVALSRSRGRSHIRLLRDFDEKIFMQKQDENLLAEDDRLEKLNQETATWWETIQGMK